ncbi:hypothetical protein ACQPYK_38505 [Streptosporangium sp. CA-135522]|uniref:hypothetical protein n=1 Tax=Streptosporangium sp. CA-135522 TaxID=3240072 RepID=UPI003D8AAE60
MTILMALMVEVEEASNPVLKERYGLTLTGKQRERLNALKLVESRKRDRAFVHLLSDAGWARMAEEIRSGISVPGGSGGPMSRVLLALMHRLLTRTGQSPADLFLLPANNAPVPAPVPTPVPAPDPAPASASEEGDVTARIRAAYAELAAEPGAWVGLAQLRPLLGDLARAEVDGALKGMIHLPEVSIVPENNQKVLTPEARAAAVTVGDQDKHLISIGVR